MDYKDRKVLIFGAGKLGKSALACYGDKFVDVFVDNDKDKQGKTYLGKPVISVDELSANKELYDVIIANVQVGAIEKQLNEIGVTPAGIFPYFVNYSIEELLHRFIHDSNKTVGLYGRDIYTKAVLYNTAYDSKHEKNNDLVLIDRDSSRYCGSVWCGKRVYSLDEVLDQLDIVIITVPIYNRAIALRLARELAAKNIAVVNPFKTPHFFPPDDFIVNRYGLSASGSTEAEFNERTKLNINSHIRKAINSFAVEAYIDTPVFSFVEMETHNRCNGACTFCPVNRNVDPRPHHKMTEALFEKVIRQLADIDYRGYISLYSNNEPFIDERLIDFSAHMREMLPNAYIYIYTNGTLLSVDKFKAIIPLLDEMAIDNYSQDLQMIPPVRKIHDFCEKNPGYKEKVTIHLRLEDEILTTRGGNSPNRSSKKAYGDVSCARPFQQLVIRPTGEVSLCCNDALGKYTMGDLKKEHILDVWYGEKFNNLRAAITKGRAHFDNCRYCDIFTLG